jgi:hypothetical protein
MNFSGNKHSNLMYNLTLTVKKVIKGRLWEGTFKETKSLYV